VNTDLGAAQISFRPLAEADFALLHRWLNTPHVLEWWDKPGPSLEQVEEKYRPRVEGREGTDCYLVLHRGSPIGMIQTYLIDDHPEYAAQVQVGSGAAGIDLFIGEPASVHRGLGAGVLRAFLRDIVFSRPEVTNCVIGPAVSNRAAIRAYEKAGFIYLKTVQVVGEEEPEYLMRIRREAVSHAPGSPITPP
jgi:RimJ/RimL family protein N-acetyltransferase